MSIIARARVAAPAVRVERCEWSSPPSNAEVGGLDPVYYGS
jgi:hypothetical protein